MLRRPSPPGVLVAVVVLVATACTGADSVDDALRTRSPEQANEGIGLPERRPDVAESTDAATVDAQTSDPTRDDASSRAVIVEGVPVATTTLADGRTMAITKPAEPQVGAAVPVADRPAPSPPGTDSAVAPAVVGPQLAAAPVEPAIGTSGVAASLDVSAITPLTASQPTTVATDDPTGRATDEPAETSLTKPTPTTSSSSSSTTSTSTSTSTTTTSTTTTTTVATDLTAARASATDAERSDAGDQQIVEWTSQGEPIPASDAAGLARQLVLAEVTVGVGADLPAMAHLQQVAYRTLAERPEWDATVLAAVPRPYLDVVQRHLSARRSFLTHATRPDVVPAWRITAPAPLDELRTHYDEAEELFGVSASHVAALHLVSSGFGRIEGTDEAGPQGPMQFLPETWERWGLGDPTIDRHAILAAARLLRGNGWEDDPRAALMAFNDTPTYVDGVLAYAELIERHPTQLAALHAWPIRFLSSVGDLWLPEGYESRQPTRAGTFTGR